MFFYSFFITYFGFYAFSILFENISIYPRTAAIRDWDKVTFTYKESRILARNAMCAIFCAWFVLCATVGDAPTLQQILLGYFGCDLFIMSYQPMFHSFTLCLHHIFACGLVIYNMYTTPRTDYYLYHLGGFGEISTFFLCFVDSFKNIPRLRNLYPMVNYYTRISFGTSFLVLRLCWWTYIIVHFEDDNSYVHGMLYSLVILNFVWAKKITETLVKLLF